MSSAAPVPNAPGSNTPVSNAPVSNAPIPNALVPNAPTAPAPLPHASWRTAATKVVQESSLWLQQYFFRPVQQLREGYPWAHLDERRLRYLYTFAAFYWRVPWLIIAFAIFVWPLACTNHRLQDACPELCASPMTVVTTDPWWETLWQGNGSSSGVRVKLPSYVEGLVVAPLYYKNVASEYLNRINELKSSSNDVLRTVIPGKFGRFSSPIPNMISREYSTNCCFLLEVTSAIFENISTLYEEFAAVYLSEKDINNKDFLDLLADLTMYITRRDIASFPYWSMLLCPPFELARLANRQSHSWYLPDPQSYEFEIKRGLRRKIPRFISGTHKSQAEISHSFDTLFQRELPSQLDSLHLALQDIKEVLAQPDHAYTARERRSLDDLTGFVRRTEEHLLELNEEHSGHITNLNSSITRQQRQLTNFEIALSKPQILNLGRKKGESGVPGELLPYINDTPYYSRDTHLDMKPNSLNDGSESESPLQGSRYDLNLKSAEDAMTIRQIIREKCKAGASADTVTGAMYIICKLWHHGAALVDGAGDEMFLERLSASYVAMGASAIEEAMKRLGADNETLVTETVSLYEADMKQKWSLICIYGWCF